MRRRPTSRSPRPRCTRTGSSTWPTAPAPEGVILNPMVQYPGEINLAFAALADPTRRAVLERLGSGSATISELARPFGMSLTGMKKHVRPLEGAEAGTA